MSLRRDLSLKRLALISWCASFWNRQRINCKVQQIIDDGKYRSDTRNLIAIAKDELKAMELPNIIYDEIIQRIIWFGERILNWYERCRKIRLPCRFTREIYWTVFGTIDEAKTVEKNFLGPDVTLSGDSEMFGMYYMACTSALKDYINRNSTKIMNFCRKHEYNREFRIIDFSFLCRSVLTLANPESLNLSKKEENQLTKKYFGSIGYSKDVFMFKLSVEKGYTAAAEYYWQQLNPLEKENNLMNEAAHWIRFCRFDIDVFVFVLSKMSENERETFFSNLVAWLTTSDRLHILLGFMESCAWEDHFFPVFYLFEDLKKHEKEYYDDVLQRIISTWKKRLTVGLDAKNPVYKQMFLAVWRKLKTFHSENHHYRSCFVRNIFELFDIDVFNAVLEKYSFREEFLEVVGIYYIGFSIENQFGHLKEFMDTVLTSPGEGAWFKSKFMANFDDVNRKPIRI